MPKQDLNAKRTERKEQWARIDFFLKNKEKLLKNAEINKSEIDKKLQAIQRESTELNKQFQLLENKENECIPLKIQRIDNPEKYQKLMNEKYPELSDTRCFTHTMRIVPNKHLQLLFSNSEKLGRKNYLKERYRLLPEQKYYFAETNGFAYGWKVSVGTGFDSKSADNTKEEMHYGRKFAIKDCVWQKNGLAMFQRERQIPLTCGAPMICSKALKNEI